MAEKLASEEGRALYKLRRQTVEPVFGVIKAVLGFAGFSLRGLDKVEGEWTLVALFEYTVASHTRRAGRRCSSRMQGAAREPQVGFIFPSTKGTFIFT